MSAWTSGGAPEGRGLDPTPAIAKARRERLRSACREGDIALERELAEFSDHIAELTEMQEVVLSLIASGLLNKQIAYHCGISETTVKAHVGALLKRLGSIPRTRAAVLYAVLLDRARAPARQPHLADGSR